LIKGSIYKRDNCILNEVKKTEKYLERAQGLLFRKPLGLGQGLVINKCNSVHSFLMSYSLDIIFLDKFYNIKKTVSNFRPYRLAFCISASQVLELQAGEVERLKIKVGDQLKWVEKID
jgi:hypothetical protein